jgi:hypothetical protein
MRGHDQQQMGVFSYVSPEQRIPHDHPLRPLRAMADEALRELQPRFNKLYAKTGRPSRAPTARAASTDATTGTVEIAASSKLKISSGSQRPLLHPRRQIVERHGCKKQRTGGSESALHAARVWLEVRFRCRRDLRSSAAH